MASQRNRSPGQCIPAARTAVRLSGLNGPPSTTSEPRLQYLAAHLHRLGPRATFELLKEVAAGADVVDRLERYARLDTDVVKALGADRLPRRLTWGSS
jgi:hypothetical protein